MSGGCCRWGRLAGSLIEDADAVVVGVGDDDVVAEVADEGIAVGCMGAPQEGQFIGLPAVWTEAGALRDGVAAGDAELCVLGGKLPGDGWCAGWSGYRGGCKLSEAAMTCPMAAPAPRPMPMAAPPLGWRRRWSWPGRRRTGSSDQGRRRSSCRCAGRGTFAARRAARRSRRRTG